MQRQWYPQMSVEIRCRKYRRRPCPTYLQLLRIVNMLYAVSREVILKCNSVRSFKQALNGQR